jgi:hypothetical protein
MQHRHVAEAVDRTLQDLRNFEGLFGGITTVFCGDWRQCLPVIPKGIRQEIVGACLTRSPIWRKVKRLELSENMRLSNAPQDREFATWLLEIGEGKHTTPEQTITLPPQMSCTENTLQSLLDYVYPPPTPEQPHDDEFFAQRAILASRNADVMDINSILINKFPGELHTFASADCIRKEPGADSDTVINAEYPPEYLSTFNCSSLPLSQLCLKVGTPIMVLRNLDPAHGVCNGTRGIITRISNRVLQVRIITGDFKGRLAFIPRITLDSAAGDFPFILSRRQFPVRLAFSMTINKSQGQSLYLLGLDLRVPVFTHGQLYVALSRCTSSSRIRVIFNPDSTTTVTSNVVYPEVLLTSD